MRSKFDRRFWILICCYLTLICILSDLHLLSTKAGQNVFVLADTKSSKNALLYSLSTSSITSSSISGSSSGGAAAAISSLSSSANSSSSSTTENRHKHKILHSSNHHSTFYSNDAANNNNDDNTDDDDNKDHELILNFNKKFLKRDKNGANNINSNYSEILTKSTINLLKKLNNSSYKRKLKKKKYSNYYRDRRSIESLQKAGGVKQHNDATTAVPVLLSSPTNAPSTSTSTGTSTTHSAKIPLKSGPTSPSSSSETVIPVIPSPPPSSSEPFNASSESSQQLTFHTLVDSNATNKLTNNFGDNKKSQSDISDSKTNNNDNKLIINNANSQKLNNLTNLIVSEMEDQIRSNPSLQDEQIIILTDDGAMPEPLPLPSAVYGNDGADDYVADEPKSLPLRPIIRGPDEDSHQGEISVVYAEQHSSVKLNCEVDLDISSSIWFKDGHMIHAVDRLTRGTATDFRFIREPRGGITIANVMLEDDGRWQCEAENARGYVENARPTKLIVLDRPKPPYLLIDSRRLDAGNIFVPVKENSELSLACVSEGGNPKPVLTWEVLLSPGVDRHAQKVAAEVLELQEVKNEKDAEPYKINSGAISEAKLPAVYRAHHNARILCVMEHPTLKMRLNASLLLDVQYTPSFAISRAPGFGYPLREGIEVSLKCDVDSNPPSTPVWQKDDGDPPVLQSGDGYLNFSSIRREHSGWYKCTSRHLNFQYSSIGYYLSIRYDSVDVTSEPGEQDISMASHNPFKGGQIEVELGGTVTLQCPQGSLGCWSQLDPITARLKGLGVGLSTPTGQFSLKDVVYQDAGTYKCIGHSQTSAAATKKKLEILQSVGVAVKGAPTATARNSTPIAHPGSPLHLSVEFCANPPAFAARWLHGDRVYTPGNQYGIDVLAYGVIDLPTPFCKEARLTYVHMHERVPRTFYFVVSSPGGVAEAIFRVNFTHRYKTMSNSVDEEEELSEPEEIHFPVFGSSSQAIFTQTSMVVNLFSILLMFVFLIRNNFNDL